MKFRSKVWIISGLLIILFMFSAIHPVFASKNDLDKNLELQVLPRGYTEQEEFITALDSTETGLSLLYPWECNPGIYGFTGAPIVKFNFPSEFASTSGVLIGWPSWGCIMPELTELIRYSAGRMEVTVIIPPQFRQSAETCLINRGITEDQLSQIEWVNMELDSIWIRDYGPEIVNGKDKKRHLIDMSYYPQLSNTCNNLFGRVNDDAAPTNLASIWNTPVYRPQVKLEGGNLLTDGKGTCFRSKKVPNAQNCFSGWCYNETELNEILGQYYNCDVIALESMEGDVIDHIDMWMTVISSKTILVGSYEPEDDPINSAILDRNAQQLKDRGYRVVRVPMPKPYCRQAVMTCVGKEHLIKSCDQPNTERVWATYMNSIRLGDTMIVPVYHWVPDDLKEEIMQQEQEALRIYQEELDREFKNSVKVIPVVSDVMIPCQGSVHCVTMTYR